jgi:hypothetical protein
MGRSLRVIAAATAVVLGLVVGTPRPAEAEVVGYVVVNGQGMMFPGLDVVPNPQFWHVDAVVSLVGLANGSPQVLTTSICQADGGSTVPESVAVGLGAGAWGCGTGPLAGRSGTLIYARVGIYMVVVLTGTLNGALLCGFAPNPIALPVQNFTLACEGPVVG